MGHPPGGSSAPLGGEGLVFDTSLELIASRRIDVRRMVTHSFPSADFLPAIETAAAKGKVMKVQVEFAT